MKLKPREINLLNEEHVKQIIEEIEGNENKARKRAAWLSFQVESGNQAHYVKEKLQEIYPKTHKKFRVGDISLVKKVVGKKAKAYKQIPFRGLDTDKETELYQGILDANHFHRGFKEGDKIFNQHKYLLYWISFINPENETDEMKFLLNALAPYEYDLIRDEQTGEPLVFILSYPDSSITGNVGTNDGKEQGITENQADTSAEHTRYAIWDLENHVQIISRKVKGQEEKIIHEIEYVVIEGNENNVNPTPGLLPIAFLSQDLSVDYPTPSNLAKQSIDWNVSLSDLKTASAAQGHGQLTIKHPEDQPIENVYSMGMHSAIDLPQSKKPEAKATEASYINANPDLQGQLDVLKFDAMQILDEHGIRAKGAVDGGVEKFASGFDRLLSEADVQDIIEDNQDLYANNCEQDIYKVIKAFHDARNKKVFTSEKLSIIFEKPKVLISDKETLENIKLRDELGLDLPYEKHIIMNPNLSDKEAIAREEEIKKAKQEKVKEMQKLVGQQIPGQAEGDEDEDDESQNNFNKQ